MKKNIFTLFVGLLILLLVACGSDDNDAKNGEQSESQEIITVEHELDTVDVPKNPEKVVVFDFGILDTLDKLNVDVAGVAQSGTIPQYLEKYAGADYENIGSLKEPDFEKIAEINPDLIIISARQSAVYDQLKELAPTIYLGVDTTNYMDSFKSNMKVVGEVFDKESEIDKELAEIEDSINSLNETAESMDNKALIILANDDKISAYGPSSRFGIIHDVFGVAPVDEGIEASTHGMNVTFEYVMEQNPDYLYVIDRGAVVSGSATEGVKQRVENDLVKNTNAYQNDKIIYLNPEYWYLSGGGLTSVAEMVNQIEESLEQ